jgi:betaine lipid synthase
MLGLSAFVPRDPFYQLAIALCFVGILVTTVFVFATRSKGKERSVGTIEAYLKFIYGCFLKPHTGDGSGSQQDALVGIECLYLEKNELKPFLGELL